MTEPINLNRVRKARAAAERKADAAANRAKHGRTKVERTSEEASADRSARLLDGAKRDRDPES